MTPGRSCDRASLRVALVYDDSLDQHAGLPQHLTMLSRGLTRLGHEVTLLVGQSSVRKVGASAVHSMARNVSVRFNGNALSMPVVSRSRTIEAVLRAPGFDVVHIQVPYSPLMAGRVIRRLDRRTALVGTFHVVAEGWLARRGARALAGATRRSLGRFDRMLSVSACAARFAQEAYGVRSTVVPNMIDLASLSPSPDAASARASGGPVIVYLGALVRRKGVDCLLEAFLLVRRALPGAQLVIAGDGPMRSRLERRAWRSGVAAAVRFLGVVSEAEKRQLFASADIACFPARFGESFGIVLLEAVAAGAGVVVAGRNAGYEELFATCPGAVCDTAPGPLADLLLALWDDEDERTRLIRAQRRLLNAHDVSGVTPQIVEIYRAALAERRWRVDRAARGFAHAG